MKAFGRLVVLMALLAPAAVPMQASAATTAPTCTLSASASSVNPNTKVRLDWTSARATAGYLTDIGAIPANGFAYVVPGKNTTYSASFTGPGGSVICRVGIGVNAGGPAVGNGGTINTNRPINLDRTVNLNSGNVIVPTPVVQVPATSGSGFIGGIVPQECRNTGTNDPLNTVKNCDVCSLAQMTQNLANFLLGLTIPAAALLFAWAGILFFSGRGVAEQINRAKQIFMTVVIGFVIALSAWILVITIMNTLIHGPDFSGWNWKSLNCTETRKARLYNMSLSEYLKSSLPDLTPYQKITPTSSGYECTSGSLQNGKCVGSDGTVLGSPVLVNSANNARNLGCSQYGDGYVVAGSQCVTNNDIPIVAGPALRPWELTETQRDVLSYECTDFGISESCAKLKAATSAGTEGKVAGVKQWETQIGSACISSGLSDCSVAKAVMSVESGGNCNQTSWAGAVGCMQLLPTTACGLDPNISGCDSCRIKNKVNDDNLNGNCQQVAQALISDPSLNINTGVKLLSNLEKKYNNDPIAVAAAYNGGTQANQDSREPQCKNMTIYQCPLNEGFKETRDYVIKVSNALTVIKSK